MILEQNLRAIEKRDPALAELLRRTAPESALETQTAKNGDPVPVYEGRPLCSRYDPRREAEAWAAKAVPDADAADHAYFIFGFGPGYHIEALMRRDPYARIVVFEPRPAWWRRLLERRDVRPIIRHKRVTVQADTDFSTGSAAFHTLAHGSFSGEIKVAALPAYQSLFPDEHAAWARQALDAVRYLRGGLATREHWKHQWLANSIANLVPIFAHPGVADLRDALAGSPAVMVAAGPSLEDHLDTLRTLVGKVPVFAAGTGLRPLIQNGIAPDYVVSIDPGKGNYEALKDYLDMPRTTLVFFSSLYPQIVAEYTGPKISAFADQEHLPRWLGEMAGWDKGFLPDAASVAIPTLEFILQLGCAEIVLLGQDLSFRDPGKFYAGKRDVEVKDYFERENVSGAPVYTTRAMLSMRRDLETRIAKAGRDGRRVYNASRTGLPLQGAAALDFAAWARRHGDARFTPPESGLDHPAPEQVMAALQAPLDTVRRELGAARSLAEAAARLLAPLITAPLPDRRALARRLDDALKALNALPENPAYARVIRRTVENLDILTRTRVLNLDTAAAEEVKNHLALLHGYAATVAERAVLYTAALDAALSEKTSPAH